jgi:hypothetical protein
LVTGRADAWHVLDELTPARVRAGWTLPVALVGSGAALVGWWLVHSVAQANLACDLFGALQSIPGVGRVPAACSGVSLRYNAGGVLVALGGLASLVAFLVAGRRGRAAARQGHPWPLRRVLARTAAAVDRLLPGHSEAPRVTPTAIGALLSCVLLAAVVAGHTAWRDHQHGAELAHRHRAELALASLALPSGVTRSPTGGGCTASVDTLCAASGQSMDKLRPVMESLLSGRTSKFMCDLLTQPQGIPCPVTVYGTIDGYPAVATVFRHLLIVRTGHPPTEAVPLHPGATRGAFFLGSDINVSLVLPDN